MRRRLLTTIALICLGAGNAWADPRSNLEAGKAAYARGDDRAAITSFGTAISGLQGEALAEAHRERARSYLRTGELVEAAQDLNQAIELNPNDGDAYGLRCLANVGLNNARRAVADMEAAFERTKTSVPAHICRGEIMYAGRRFKEAVASFDEAMRLGANDYQLRTSRALAMIWAGRPDEAIRELDVLIEAAQGAPGSTRAKLYEARARGKITKGDLDGALADASRAVELSEGGGILAAERHAFRARVHVLQANFDQAVSDINAALALLSDAREERLAPLYATRAGAFAAQGEVERAISDFDEAIRRGKDLPGPQLAAWHVGRARANVALGRRDAAAEDFDRAVRAHEKDPDILVERGDNRLYQGNPAAALADYEAALQLDPQNVGAQSRRGWALIEQGRYEEAIAAAEKVVQQQPESATGYWDRGVFRFLAGRFAEAEADFAQVVQIRPENMHAMMWGHIARGRVGNSGRDTLARQIQGQDLERWPGPVAQVLLGISAPEAALSATRVPEPGRQRRRECEAHFYLGQHALLRNDQAAAEEHFRQAVETGVREFVEYVAARVELQRMGR